jgi:quinohemoprotein ethanol dehydrogenase
VGALLVSCLSPAAVGAEPGPSTEAIASGRLTSDWPSYGNGYAENHYSPLEQIRPDNLEQLGLLFHVDLDSGQRTDSQPLAYEGTLYIATGLSIVQAIDAVSGKVLWRHDPGMGKLPGDKLRAGWGIRGLALERGRIFVATQDGRLLALDARSGALLWSTQTLDPHDETTITGAPRVFNGKVVIGYTGGDRELGRGALQCFDAGTGKFLWRFYTVPPPPAAPDASEADRTAQRTWSGEWWKNSGGGAVWNGITFDAKYNRVYIGTGNAGPWNWKIRHPGDNLYTASIVALDADTGRYLWH